MAKKTVRDIDLKGKRVVMRVDFNVPLKGGKVTDDTRIRAALDTVRYILGQPGASLICMSHLGRPKGRDPEQSLAPVAARFQELLGRDVKLAPDCIGPEVALVVNVPTHPYRYDEPDEYRLEPHGTLPYDWTRTDG